MLVLFFIVIVVVIVVAIFFSFFTVICFICLYSTFILLLLPTTIEHFNYNNINVNEREKLTPSTRIETGTPRQQHPY